MKLRAGNVAWLLPLFLTACLHKTHQAQTQQFAPPVSTAPKPPAVHPELPSAAVILPVEPVDNDTDAIVEEAGKPAVKHRKLAVKVTPDGSDNTPAGPPNSQQATNESGEVPAIGELSSGDPSDLRRETSDSITDIERGLKGVGRPLNGQEQKTAAQIRQFIRQARKALTTGDVDGAHTLAAKAKILLGELSE